MYFAACTGADEEDEVVLLKEFKEKLQSIEIKKDENSELIERNIKVLESTFTAAKKHIEETAFQRKRVENLARQGISKFDKDRIFRKRF